MKKYFVAIVSFLLLSAAVVPAKTAPSVTPEYIVLVGGPSLMMWEKYKAEPHDHWWANFVRAARIRTEQLRDKYGPDAKITWLIYKQGYVDRGVQEKMDLLGFLDSIREKFNLNMVYIKNGEDVINYLNHGQPRDQVKVAFFEYFGHSNKACFMFDYSSNVDSACKAWLHEKQLAEIDRSVFTKDAAIRSWGCHTGELMSQSWHRAVGNRMWGVVGKTQYMTDELPVIATPGGKWAD